ncbi:hypothetical protein W822_21330 [Advenella kashmirensis W13003]|uniref:Uncharacterized protein n=1 Tax=Advenella kashmirensis W13003 TaxID=1424334 RepID=V8QPQ0_9BURK|nr:hypothetical protein [Advenella kashmirensis]ETF00974.1 hypothetical protein W822_21330 [Advenella kashmirensis W13003]
MDYTGEEIGFEANVNGYNADSEEILYYLPPGVKADSVPIFDEEENAVIGFHWTDPSVPKENQRFAPHVTYDIEGKIISESHIYDPPIQPVYPLENAILFFVGGTGIRAIFSGGKSLVVGGGTRLARSFAIGAGSGLITQSAITALKVSFRVLTTREIFKFTATTLRHMGETGRYVPTQILYLAFRYGKKTPDPKGIAGLFRYEIPIKTVTSANGQVRNRVLEVVIRDKDLTIMHFLYK